jgi:hypothetical protein
MCDCLDKMQKQAEIWAKEHFTKSKGRILRVEYINKWPYFRAIVKGMPFYINGKNHAYEYSRKINWCDHDNPVKPKYCQFCGEPLEELRSHK